MPPSHPCPYALLLWPVSTNFPVRWTLLKSRYKWKNNSKKEWFFRETRSPLERTMQPHNPSCWHDGREKAGWPQQHSLGAGKGAAKAPLGSAALTLKAKSWLRWCNSLYLHALILLSLCSWHPGGLTLVVQVAIFGGKNHKTTQPCTSQWTTFDSKYDKPRFVWPLQYLAPVLLASIKTGCSPQCSLLVKKNSKRCSKIYLQLFKKLPWFTKLQSGNQPLLKTRELAALGTFLEVRPLT